jgi:HSP20 family protein
MKERRSFFERLTGAMRVPDDSVEEEVTLNVNGGGKRGMHVTSDESIESEIGDGELMVDVYQTPTDIVIKTMVPGVRPEDLDITITRDMVTLKGKREIERTISDENYFHKELYWGSFSRTIMLPQEVEIEEAEAVEKHGLLIIRLPKLDKHRQSKLRVRNN